MKVLVRWRSVSPWLKTRQEKVVVKKAEAEVRSEEVVVREAEAGASSLLRGSKN
jgi:hypothetical protein